MCYSRLIAVIITAMILTVMCCGTATAEPQVQSVSASFVHKRTVVIRGSGFGSKTPAAPLMWDDCDGKAVDNDSAVTESGWVDVWPS